jgi:hypothetical protein
MNGEQARDFIFQECIPMISQYLNRTLDFEIAELFA